MRRLPFRILQLAIPALCLAAAPLIATVSAQDAGAPEKPAARPTTAPATAPATRPAKEPELPIPPKLSARDINRLKLYELPLDGEPEKVNVELRKKRGEAAIEDAVRRLIEDGADADPDWRRILERGRPYEKLQLIRRVTKMQFADRMVIKGDTEKFEAFRRRVLPLVIRGCARSGCHGGTGPAAWFRLPSGAQSTEEFAYSSFYILDLIHTPIGPMLNRDLPEDSALLKYMLPSKSGPDARATPLHPPVRNQPVGAVIERTDSRQYKEVLEWISSLRVPHPGYEVDYAAPDWLAALAKPPARKPEPDPEPVAASASAPASRPGD